MYDINNRVGLHRRPIDRVALSTTPFLGMKVQWGGLGGGEGTGKCHPVVVACDGMINQVPVYQHRGFRATHFICDKGHQPAGIWLSSPGA